MENRPEWAALAGDLHVQVGAQFTDFQFTHDPTTGRTRLQRADDAILVDDGNAVWLSPPTAAREDAAFTARAWLFIAALPLRMPGAALVEEGPRRFGAEEVPSAKLVPDRRSPIEWAIVYADPKTHRLRGVAVKFRDPPALLSAVNPIAVTFYTDVRTDGVTFPGEWLLWAWRPETGIYGEPIGRGRLYNIELKRPAGTAFVPARGAAVVGP